jgi:hypothetical protein
MEAKSAKASHDPKICWVTPEDVLESLNYIRQFGEDDKPVQFSECFQVWGRGRPRPSVDNIILPNGTSLQSDFPQEKSTKGRGRGRLLLLENISEQYQDPCPTTMFDSNDCSCVDKKMKKFGKGIGKSNLAYTKITLKDLEDKYNRAKLLGSKKPIFDIDNDFPPLQ